MPVGFAIVFASGECIRRRGGRGVTVRNNNGDGISWQVCHDVLVENCTSEGNPLGISTGHCSTDNLIKLNEIRGSKVAGVLFRPERNKDFAGHRNRLVKNRLIDNGDKSGAAIDIQGGTDAITVTENEITETREPAERVAVRIGVNARQIAVSNNQIRGFAKETDEDKRQKGTVGSVSNRPACSAPSRN